MKNPVKRTALAILIIALATPFVTKSQTSGNDKTKSCRLTLVSPDAPANMSCVGQGISCADVFDCFSIFDDEQ